MSVAFSDDAASQAASSGAAHLSRQHGLRPMDSRFSLHEQFAMTRREIEFGFDDASSLMGTLASGSAPGPDPDDDDDDDDDDHANKAEADGDGPDAPPRRPLPAMRDLLARDHYELLCLARDADLDDDQIRRAYFRLLRILGSERLPPRTKQAADGYFAEVQTAFETLIEPARRRDYDWLLADDGGVSDDEADDAPVGPAGHVAAAGGAPAARQLLRMRRLALQTTTDLGIRLDATRVLSGTGRGRRRRRGPVRPLDLSIGHAVHMGVPALGQTTEAAADAVQRLVARLTSTPKPRQVLRCGVPTVSVSASAYALLEDLLLLPSTLLSDRYQPLLPETLPRRRLLQLAEGRPSALVTARYRQELFHGGQAAATAATTDRRLPDAVVELESDILPAPAFTARAGAAVPVEGEPEPVHVEAMLHAGPGWAGRPAARAGLALHRRLGAGGTAFACLDSGDGLWPAAAATAAATCRFFDAFSHRGTVAAMGRRVLAALPPPTTTAPTLEVGYCFSPCEMGLRADRPLTRPADRGLRGLDADADTRPGGTWTASAAVGARSAAAYLRYGRDLALPAAAACQPPLRLEAELATGRLFDSFLALRALSRLSPTARLGFELALGPATLHLSLYLSRAGSRLKLPLLLAAGPAARTPRLLFWTTVLPLAALAAVQFFRRRRAVVRPSLAALGRDGLAAYVAARRAEADALTALLAPAAEPRQAAERAAGGLVVLSAKYGVRGPAGDWAAADEVADVTVAVAALVDPAGRGLLIPAGLRKSRLLGFWDPAPLRTKTLLVRYLYRGREGVVEVRGRDEVRLPPVAAAMAAVVVGGMSA